MSGFRKTDMNVKTPDSIGGFVILPSEEHVKIYFYNVRVTAIQRNRYF